jgi:hypothetical protein
LAADVEDVNVKSMAVEPRDDLIEQPPDRVAVEEGGHEPDPYTRVRGGRRWGERRARHGVQGGKRGDGAIVDESSGELRIKGEVRRGDSFLCGMVLDSLSAISHIAVRGAYTIS